MTRREIVITTCDLCAHESKADKDATVSYKIKIDRQPLRAIDVCSDHASIIERLKATLSSRGTRA